MPTARKYQVDLATTPYYHCYNRCVRRAKLFWKNESGETCYQRRDILVARLKKLSLAFSIQLPTYSIMENHYHLVLHVDTETPKDWDNNEVRRRLKILYPTTAETATPKKLTEWKKRFVDISWYMRLLNEYMARVANKEDDVTGRFWEGRFKSQALVDKGALLACMAYVDLNPIRAGLAKTLPESLYTGIKERLDASEAPSHLMPMATSPASEDNSPPVLPFSLTEYHQLVEWTGKNIQLPNKAMLSNHIPSPLVEQTGLNPDEWLNTVQSFQSPYQSVIAHLTHMKTWAKKIKQHWLKGNNASRRRYRPT